MHYTDTVYRPPFEADSLLLQVTRGCSHNACSFCTMYRDVPYSVESFEQIEEDLKEASLYASHVNRVFLEHGDPFSLSAEKLKRIAELIHAYLPETETIAMYASVKNIRNKTDEELAELRSLGINELNIGVESGLNEALAHMNKGYTASDAEYELMRLKKAGIDWGANIIFGCAGKGNEKENAAATAALLNRTKPYLIFTGTIHAEKGCPLYDEIQTGSFEEGTIGDYLDEEEEFLRLLELDECFFFGLHPSNIARMRGMLAKDREKMIEHVRYIRNRLHERLDEIVQRMGEGALIL